MNENARPAPSADPEVHLYADGACSGNPGPGGWGVVLKCPELGLEKHLSGAEANTTNNRMELTAVIRGLRALLRPCRVAVTTDSRYVVDAFEKNWLANWRRNGWRTASKQAVKNEDLWRELLEALAAHRVKWNWIRGHAGHPENETADRLAVAARQGGSGGRGESSPVKPLQPKRTAGGTSVPRRRRGSKGGRTRG